MHGVFVGLTTIDLIYYLSGHLSENSKRKADKQLSFAGGPVANAAITFSALGSTSTVVSGLGANAMSSIARDDLAKYSVRFIDGLSAKITSPVISAILVDTITGNRSVAYYKSATEKLNLEDSVKSTLSHCNLLMIDGHYLDQAIPFAIAAKEKGIPVILDGGSWKTGLEEVLPFIDYAICSSNFMPPKCSSVNEVFAFFSETTIRYLAITHGEKSIIAKIDNKKIEIPITPVEAIDTLGAGDVFHGAFCHYIMRKDFVKSLELAAGIASESCKYYGPREWALI